MPVAVASADVSRLGSTCAIFYSQLRYWSSKAAGGQAKCLISRDSKTWVRKTREQWGEETGLSPKQVRASLERLKAEGVVETARYKDRVGRVVLHIRIVSELPKKAASNAPKRANSKWPKKASSYSRNIVPTLKTEKEDYLLVPPNGLTPNSSQAEKEPEKKVDIAEVKDHASSGGGEYAPQPIDGKDTPMHTAKDVLEGYRVSTSKGDAAALSKIRAAFYDEHSKAYPGVFVPPFGAKENGQLKMIMKAIPKELDAEAVLRHTVRNWADYCVDAKIQAGAFDAPGRPVLGFMLKFVGSAVNFYIDAKGAKSAAVDVNVKPKQGLQLPKGIS